MSIFKPARKAAKFAFVAVPAGIFGWQLNKRLFFWLRSLWSRSVNPACPSCDGGVLYSQASVDPVLEHDAHSASPRQLYPWVCNHCGWAVLESLDAKRVREVVARARAERAMAAFPLIEMAEREAISKKHRVGSRIFFGVAALTFANGVYMLASGMSVFLVLNWMSFSFMFWVLGMKRSYRAWQVTSGHLFEEGALKYWLKHEKWLI